MEQRLNRTRDSFTDFTPEQMTFVVSELQRVIRLSDDPLQKERLQWAVEMWRGALLERGERSGSGSPASD